MLIQSTFLCDLETLQGMFLDGSQRPMQQLAVEYLICIGHDVAVKAMT